MSTALQKRQPERFGNRRVPKMYAQINDLRQAIAAEGSPRVQAAWGKVEEHIDFAYQQVAAHEKQSAEVCAGEKDVA